MVITFYKINDDYRVVDKTLGTSTGSATGVLHEKANNLNLSVKIPGTLFNVVTASNYCFIDTTQAYYYLDSYDIENDCVIINLKEDVRKTWATQIKGVTATVNRQQNLAQAYLADSNYQAMAYEAVATKRFPGSLTDFSYILMTVG